MNGNQEALFEIDCGKVYDERDPKLEQIVKKYENKIIQLPFTVRE